MVFKLSPQNETLNSTSHAGHVISLSPGRLFIRNLRSHDGHEISIFGLLGFKTKWVWQDEHCKFAGLLPTPQINTLEQEGQLIFSSLHFFPCAFVLNFYFSFTHYTGYDAESIWQQVVALWTRKIWCRDS